MTSFSSSSGQLQVRNTNDLFVDFAYSVPLIVASANLAISSLFSKENDPNFKAILLFNDYTNSAAQNVTYNNYSMIKEQKDNIIISTYTIPYNIAGGSNPYITDGQTALVKITTYFNILTQILFYTIPPEFTSNIKNNHLASVALYQTKDRSIIGQGLIPQSFYSGDNKGDIRIDFNIEKIINTNINTFSYITETSNYQYTASSSINCLICNDTPSEDCLTQCYDCCQLNYSNNINEMLNCMNLC